MQLLSSVTKTILPDDYRGLSEQELVVRLGRAREELGRKAIILGHNYQRDEVIRFSDVQGDSLKLSRYAAEHRESPYIVFCGVHFMAESADILTSDEQIVTLPDITAGCPMADMAAAMDVGQCWEQLTRMVGEDIVPVTYINSAATLKAFCGRTGGIVCTSSNAEQVFQWAFEQKSRVLFFPDENLGRNIAAKLNIPEEKILTWDWKLKQQAWGCEELKNATLILWKGFCPVHTPFSVQDIHEWRRKHPTIKILVHPECTKEVVDASDLCGSTQFIMDTIAHASPGSIWAIGTEVHMVNRLRRMHPDKQIMLLKERMCLCSMMDRTSPEHLLWNLESLVKGQIVNQVAVDNEIKQDARIALERMLTL